MIFKCSQNNGYEKKGFTLIEILVSVSIFSVVMLIAVTTLLSLVDANRKAQSMQLVMNNLNFAVDHLTRALATGRNYYCQDIDVEDSGYTLPANTAENNCLDGENGIVVLTDKGLRTGYAFQGGQLWRNVEDEGWLSVTSEDVVIEHMLFMVRNTDPSDGLQPTVNILVSGYAEGIRNTSSDFNLQTKVTQRLLDR